VPWLVCGRGEKGREREGGEERDDERSPGRLREVKNWRTADVSFESRFVRCEPGKWLTLW